MKEASLRAPFYFSALPLRAPFRFRSSSKERQLERAFKRPLLPSPNSTPSMERWSKLAIPEQNQVEALLKAFEDIAKLAQEVGSPRDPIKRFLRNPQWRRANSNPGSRKKAIKKPGPGYIDRLQAR